MERETPRWLLSLFFVATCLIALMLFLNRDRLHVYQTYFRENSPEVTLRFEELSKDMDEATIRQHFQGVQLDCFNQSSGMGDRTCYTPTSKADGLPALTLAIFFKKGKLSTAIVQVPWWAHPSWLKRLKLQASQPRQDGTTPGRGAVLRWDLPNGYLNFNQNRGIDPLGWSVLVWVGT